MPVEYEFNIDNAARDTSEATDIYAATPSDAHRAMPKLKYTTDE
jgi:hypothetical protein